MDEWIGKIYLYIMMYEAAIKKGKCVAFIGKWMQFENIVLSEISQTDTQA